MGHPSSFGDALDAAELADLLGAFRDDPALWRSADGRRVLREARHRYAALAAQTGLDEADGATHAWQFWTQELTDAALHAHRDDLWSYTAGEIRRSLLKEDQAQSRLVSVKQLRHVAVDGMTAPVRFQSAADLPSSTDLITDPFAEPVEQIAPVAGIGGKQAVTAVKHLLVLAGFTPVQRDLVFDEIAKHLHDTASVRAAADALHRKRNAIADDIGAERWRALVSLMLGTPKGTPGIIRLIGEGHPSPMSEPHIARLVSVFLAAPPIRAAGVA